MYYGTQIVPAQSGIINAAAVEYAQIYSEIKIEKTGIPVTIKPCTYAEYNFFVSQYNHPTNRIEQKFLKPVPSWCFMDIRSYCKIYLAIIFSWLPFTCILILILSIIKFILLVRVIFIVRHNRGFVPNPFLNMVYLESFEKNNEYFRFTTTQQVSTIFGVGISIDNFSAIHAKFSNMLIERKPVEIMVYKSIFSGYEKNVLKKMCKSFTITIIMIFFSFIMTFPTIVLITNFSSSN